MPITLNTGTDGGAGINPATTVVKRDVATLNTTTETCGAFPGTFATTVTLVGGADTSVTSGKCYQYRYTVFDRVGNSVTHTSSSVVKVDTSGPRVTAISSQQSSGSAGNGQLQVGDKLLLTFNQSLASSSVPTSFNGATERSTGTASPDTLTVPGITNGAVSTGSASYLPDSTTATFGGHGRPRQQRHQHHRDHHDHKPERHNSDQQRRPRLCAGNDHHGQRWQLGRRQLHDDERLQALLSPGSRQQRPLRGPSP